MIVKKLGIGIISIISFSWFYGIGNQASAEVTCDDGVTKCAYTSLCDCFFEDPNYVCSACKVPPPPACGAGEILVDDGAGGKVCCDAECQNIRNAIGGPACSPPVGGNQNALGVCVCPKGTKKVDNICKGCGEPGVCCGVQLNTNVPFIGDCIETKSQNPQAEITEENAFGFMMGGLTKLLVSAILIISFLVIIAGGVLIATAGADASAAKKGKDLIKGVVIGIALLGASGVILRLINPNFFG